MNRNLHPFNLLMKIFYIIIILLLLILIIGFSYQTYGNWKDSKRFPQVGKTRQIDSGIQLNIYCTGTGNTTVILEAQGGMTGRVWAEIQPEIAKFTRVCSYDRAGYGYSEAAKNPKTVELEAKELKSLLEAAGEKGPFILVGHSFGGFMAQAFALQNPNQVAGLVLIDASYPDFLKKNLEVLSPDGKVEFQQFLDIANSKIVLGLLKFSSQIGISRLTGPKDNLLKTELNYLVGTTKSIDAFSNENELFSKSEDYIRGKSHGDIPLIVLTAGKGDPNYKNKIRW